MEISTTKIDTYIQCRKKFDFVYNEQIEPIDKGEALTTGANYHEAIATFLTTGTKPEIDDIKTRAMFEMFCKIIYPQLDKIAGVEAKYTFNLQDDINLIGYVDAITSDGIPIEHKTTSKPVDEFYVNRLNWDNQVAIYMLLCKCKQCYYTVCQKPTIKQKANESDDEFYCRCLEWYDENTTSKVGLFVVNRSDEELAKKLEEVKAIANEIKNQKLFYRNPKNCMILSCPYSSICLDYDKNVMPIGFQKRENRRLLKGGEVDD